MSLYQIKILFFLIHFSCCANQYLYPVAAAEFQEGFFLFVVHQEAPNKLQLYFWDPDLKTMQKALSSRFCPIDIQIIPGQKGFSFIDTGRVRIKEFLKKSPRSLDLDQPLYGFSHLEWIDGNRFYTSAKRGSFFGVFQINQDGEIVTILAHQGFDYIYPQKIEDQLFCVERFGGQCSIIKTPYLQVEEKKEYLSGVEAILAAEQKGKKSLVQRQMIEVLYEVSPDQQIIFLQASKKDSCFFLQHPAQIDSLDETILFSYHQIKRIGCDWEHEKLFCFSIPTELLLTEEKRLHESILRLVPYHYKDQIYFSDSTKNGLNLLSYNLSTGQVQKELVKEANCFFAPFIFKDKIFYGIKKKDLSDEILQHKIISGL